MDPTPELAAKLDQDRLEAAEAMTFGQRLLAAPQLFDIGIMMMRAGIRLDHPNASPEFVEEQVVERLRNARRFET